MRSSRFSFISSSMVIAWIFPILAFAQTTPTPFSQMFNPVGVAVDTGGYVYITSDTLTAPIITQFTPEGNIENQSTIPGIPAGSQGYLAIDPVTGQIFDLVSSGQILLIDPETLEVSPFYDITGMDIDTKAIFDITTGTVQTDLSDIILPQMANYGDIAVYHHTPETLDLLVSGAMEGYPFILHIRRYSDGTNSARVLVSSMTPGNPEVTHPPGVGVNGAGTVVTTLPSYPGGEYVVSFDADFPETGTGTPLAHLVGITSQGIGTDSEGNYYIATGLDDIPMCDMEGGAVVMVNATLDQFSCSPPDLGIGLTYDVSIHPDDSGLYLSASNGIVWYYGLTS